MKKDYVHVCVVLDASGSMSSIEADIKGSFNTFMAEQKKAQGKTVLDVFQFSDEVKHIVEHADLSDFKDDLMASYVCCGMTALHDAVCTAVDKLGRDFAAMPEEERPESVIFAIITDGCENSSREFSLKDVKERIDRQTKEYSWEFVYLAANQDEFEAERINRSMGVQFSQSTMSQAELADLSSRTLCSTLEMARRRKKSGK